MSRPPSSNRQSPRRACPTFRIALIQLGRPSTLSLHGFVAQLPAPLHSVLQSCSKPPPQPISSSSPTHAHHHSFAITRTLRSNKYAINPKQKQTDNYIFVYIYKFQPTGAPLQRPRKHWPEDFLIKQLTMVDERGKQDWKTGWFKNRLV